MWISEHNVSIYLHIGVVNIGRIIAHIFMVISPPLDHVSAAKEIGGVSHFFRYFTAGLYIPRYSSFPV